MIVCVYLCVGVFCVWVRSQEEVEAQKKQLQAELGRMQSNNNSKEMEELKEQLRVRNQRDQDISRRLRNGHNTISQALREQQLAAAAALEVLPCVDVIHDSFLSTFQADFLSMQVSFALLVFARGVARCCCMYIHV